MNNASAVICNKTDEIASTLLNTPPMQEIGLYTGNAGIALFLFRYARFKGDPAIHQRASAMIDALFEQIEAAPQPSSLCSGIAGVGWLLDHLCRQRFIQADPDDMLSDTDEYLYKAALAELSRGHFDFLHGAMGIALYFVRRNRRDYLLRLVQALASIAVWDDDGAKWQSVIRHEERTTGFNIALSHGSSSIALVLGKALQIMPKEEAVRILLNGAAAYILRQEIPAGQHGCYFPGFSIESQPELFKTRLAWCYGDLGVALAVRQSGQILHNQAWIDKGTEVLLHAAGRRGLQENMVRDAGICHGTAGIAHIFNRLYRNTKRTEFKEAGDYWCQETLKMDRFSDGLAGYKTWRTEEYGGWQTSESLLEGIAGIGLSLLSFVMPEDPAWDECLLLS